MAALELDQVGIFDTIGQNLLNAQNFVYLGRSRSARQANNNKCAEDCEEKIKRETLLVFPDIKYAVGNEFKAVDSGNESDLAIYCEIYRPGAKCFDACPESRMKLIFTTIHKLRDTMCVQKYNEFKRNFQCMINEEYKHKGKCVQQCKSHQDEYVGLATRKYINSDGQVDRKEGSRLLKGTCQYLDCQLNCTLPFVKEGCGAEAAGLERDMVVTSFDSLNRMMEQTNPNNTAFFYPAECARLSAIKEK